MGKKTLTNCSGFVKNTAENSFYFRSEKRIVTSVVLISKGYAGFRFCKDETFFKFLRRISLRHKKVY